ncbi:MAG: hypothetical protein CV045_01825 [Cyanobacteria bacterium M5B4]|nr:MAG: hypothetical protein CV045_01825 [Cyanobacteria bacterium M5B4]
MNIYEFFQQRAGVWLSQCTSRNLLTQVSGNQRQQIKVELVAPDRLQICVDQQTSQLIALPQGEGFSGKLLLQNALGEYQGEFKISADRVLTITIVKEDCLIEEKLWFPLPNLCMRTAAGLNQTQFWTEVRKLS